MRLPEAANKALGDLLAFVLFLLPLCPISFMECSSFLLLRFGVGSMALRAGEMIRAMFALSRLPVFCCIIPFTVRVHSIFTFWPSGFVLPARPADHRLGAAFPSSALFLLSCHAVPVSLLFL